MLTLSERFIRCNATILDQGQREISRIFVFFQMLVALRESLACLQNLHCSIQRLNRVKVQVLEKYWANQFPRPSLYLDYPRNLFIQIPKTKLNFRLDNRISCSTSVYRVLMRSTSYVLYALLLLKESVYCSRSDMFLFKNLHMHKPPIN